MGTRSTGIVVALLVGVGCSSRPLATDGEVDGSTSASTGGVTASPLPTGGFEPTSGGAGESSTGGAPSTGEATGDSEGSDTSGDATTGGPLLCGGCAETWEHEGSLSILASEDLAGLECLGVVHGDLGISGDVSAEDLAVLSSVRHIDGSLAISSDDVLVDLSPFSCLRAAGTGVFLHGLPNLTDISGLSQIEVAPIWWIVETGIVGLPVTATGVHGVQMVQLKNNPALADLSPAANWSAAEMGFGALDFPAVWIESNPGLTSLEGMQGLLDGGGLRTIRLKDLPLASLDGLETLSGGELAVELVDLPALASLAGLEGLTGGELRLIDLPLVPDLAPLSGLKSGDWLELDGMPLVSSLVGLHNLEQAGVLELGGKCRNDGVGMDGLVDLSGLDALVTVGSLHVIRSDQFASFAGAGALTSLTGLIAAEDPLLDAATVDAFVAELAPMSVCVQPMMCVGCLDDNGGH